jgi:hypothetical protein
MGGDMNWTAPGDDQKGESGNAPVPPDSPQPPQQPPAVHPPAPVPPGAPGPQSAPQLAFLYPTGDPQQNWGLAVPVGAGRPEMLVPRPPKPASAGLATLLAYIGVGLSVVYLVANSIYQYQNKDRVIDEALTGLSKAEADQARSIMGTFMGGAVIFTAVLYLLIAAGVVVCTALTVRKKNPARIVLAATMGVLGAYNLCQVGSGGLVAAVGPTMQRRAQATGVNYTDVSSQITWWSVALQALLAVIALTVFVMLIVPTSNKYFSPGAGRRFAPEE